MMSRADQPGTNNVRFWERMYGSSTVAGQIGSSTHFGISASDGDYTSGDYASVTEMLSTDGHTTHQLQSAENILDAIEVEMKRNMKPDVYQMYAPDVLKLKNIFVEGGSAEQDRIDAEGQEVVKFVVIDVFIGNLVLAEPDFCKREIYERLLEKLAEKVRQLQPICGGVKFWVEHIGQAVVETAPRRNKWDELSSVFGWGDHRTADQIHVNGQFQHFAERFFVKAGLVLFELSKLHGSNVGATSAVTNAVGDLILPSKISAFLDVPEIVYYLKIFFHAQKVMNPSQKPLYELWHELESKKQSGNGIAEVLLSKLADADPALHEAWMHRNKPRYPWVKEREARGKNAQGILALGARVADRRDSQDMTNQAVDNSKAILVWERVFGDTCAPCAIADGAQPIGSSTIFGISAATGDYHSGDFASVTEILSTDGTNTHQLRSITDILEALELETNLSLEPEFRKQYQHKLAELRQLLVESGFEKTKAYEDKEDEGVVESIVQDVLIEHLVLTQVDFRKREVLERLLEKLSDKVSHLQPICGGVRFWVERIQKLATAGPNKTAKQTQMNEKFRKFASRFYVKAGLVLFELAKVRVSERHGTDEDLADASRAENHQASATDVDVFLPSKITSFLRVPEILYYVQVLEHVVKVIKPSPNQSPGKASKLLGELEKGKEAGSRKDVNERLLLQLRKDDTMLYRAWMRRNKPRYPWLQETVDLSDVEARQLWLRKVTDLFWLTEKVELFGTDMYNQISRRKDQEDVKRIIEAWSDNWPKGANDAAPQVDLGSAGQSLNDGAPAAPLQSVVQSRDAGADNVETGDKGKKVAEDGNKDRIESGAQSSAQSDSASAKHDAPATNAGYPAAGEGHTDRPKGSEGEGFTNEPRRAVDTLDGNTIDSGAVPLGHNDSLHHEMPQCDAFRKGIPPARQLMSVLFNLLRRHESWTEFLRMLNDSVLTVQERLATEPEIVAEPVGEERAVTQGKQHGITEESHADGEDRHVTSADIRCVLDLLNVKGLFWMALENAHEDLKVQLMQDFSGSGMPVPLIYPARRDEFDEADDSEAAAFESTINPYVFYCLPHTKCVGIFSFGIGELFSEQSGKTELVNDIFETKFDKKHQSFFTYGSVDVDVSASFRDRRLVIADAHGRFDVKWYPMLRNFSHLLIHVAADELQNVDMEKINDGACSSQVMQDLKKLSNADSDNLVESVHRIFFLIRDVDCSQRKQPDAILSHEELEKMFPHAVKSMTTFFSKVGVQLRAIAVPNLSAGLPTSLSDSRRSNIVFNKIKKQILESVEQQWAIDKSLRETDNVLGELAAEFMPSSETDKYRFVTKSSFVESIVRAYPPVNAQNAYTTLSMVNVCRKEFLEELSKYKSDFYHADLVPVRTLLRQLRDTDTVVNAPESNTMNRVKAVAAKAEEARKICDEIKQKLRVSAPSRLLKLFLHIISDDYGVDIVSELAGCLKIFTTDSVARDTERKEALRVEIMSLRKDEKKAGDVIELDDQGKAERANIEEQIILKEKSLPELRILYEQAAKMPGASPENQLRPLHLRPQPVLNGKDRDAILSRQDPEFRATMESLDEEIVKVYKQAEIRLAAQKNEALKVREQEMKEIVASLDSKTFSIEVPWRELMTICENTETFQFTDDQGKECNTIEALCKFIRRGQAFELIDGDNLRFSTKVLEKVFSNFADKRIFVISVLGPQSSGKSTLLNFLCGSKFGTSAGRCTRGIYGTIISLDGNPYYDMIFILDTEGLQSTEKNDPEFDRKITLFAFAVSHLVLINVKGDMHAAMKQLLEICVLSLHDLQRARMSIPDVFFIFNQNAEPSKEPFLKQIENMTKNIVEAHPEAAEVARVMEPEEADLFVLSFAFHKKLVPKNPEQGQLEDWCATEPESMFAVEVASILDRIFHSMAKRYQSGKTNPTQRTYEFMEPWVQMAASNWKAIQDYRALTAFADVKEMQEHRQLSKMVKEWFSELLEAKAQYEHQQMMMDQLEQIDENRIHQAGYIKNQEGRIKQYFREHFDGVRLDMEERLSAASQEIDFRKILVDSFRRRIFDRVQSFQSEIFSDITREIQQITNRVGRLKGLSTLEKKISELCAEGDRDEREVERIFHETFDSILGTMRTEIDFDANAKQLFEDMKQIYQQEEKLPQSTVGNFRLQSELMTLVVSDDQSGADAFTTQYMQRFFSVEGKELFIQAPEVVTYKALPPVTLRRMVEESRRRDESRDHYVSLMDFYCVKSVSCFFNWRQFPNFVKWSEVVGAIEKIIDERQLATSRYRDHHWLKNPDQLQQSLDDLLTAIPFTKLGWRFRPEFRTELKDIVLDTKFCVRKFEVKNRLREVLLPRYYIWKHLLKTPLRRTNVAHHTCQGVPSPAYPYVHEELRSRANVDPNVDEFLCFIRWGKLRADLESLASAFFFDEVKFKSIFTAFSVFGWEFERVFENKAKKIVSEYGLNPRSDMRELLKNYSCFQSFPTEAHDAYVAAAPLYDDGSHSFYNPYDSQSQFGYMASASSACPTYEQLISSTAFTKYINQGWSDSGRRIELFHRIETDALEDVFSETAGRIPPEYKRLGGGGPVLVKREQFKGPNRFSSGMDFLLDQQSIDTRYVPRATRQLVDLVNENIHGGWRRVLKDLHTVVEKEVDLPAFGGHPGDSTSTKQSLAAFSVALVKNIRTAVEDFIRERLAVDFVQFGLKLNMDAAAALHFYALLVSWKKLQQHLELHVLEPVRSMQDERQTWLNYFMSSVSCKPLQTSHESAKLLVTNVADEFLKWLRTAAGDEFQKMIDPLRPRFVSQEFQKELDQALLFAGNQDERSIQKAVDYITDQSNTVKAQFEELFGVQFRNMMNEVVRSKQTVFYSMLVSFRDKVEKLKTFLDEQGLQDTYSAHLFRGPSSRGLSEHSPGQAADLGQELGEQDDALYNTNHDKANKEAYDFFLKYVQDEYRTAGGIADLPEKLKGAVETASPLPDGELDPRASPGLAGTRNRKTWITEYNTVTALRVPSLYHFCDKVLELMPDIVTQASTAAQGSPYTINSGSLRVDKIYNEFKRSSIGCIEKCPTCGRKCDQDVNDANHKHSCALGHQIRGMSGIRLENKEASVECCESITNDRRIWLEKEQRWTQWGEIKRKHRQWDYEKFAADAVGGSGSALSEEQIEERHDRALKMQAAWRLYGPALCKKFNEMGNPIVFTANQRKATGTEGSGLGIPTNHPHFVLAIDESGSMEGEKFRKAIDGALQFTRCLFRTPTIMSPSVTVILFDDGSRTLVRKATQDTEVVAALSRYPYRGGGTSFEVAFQQAATEIRTVAASNRSQRATDQIEGHVILFYTDGECRYPANAISTLQAMRNNVDGSGAIPISLFAISEGSSESLKQICKTLHPNDPLEARLKQNIAPDQLANVLAEIIA